MPEVIIQVGTSERRFRVPPITDDIRAAALKVASALDELAGELPGIDRSLVRVLAAYARRRPYFAQWFTLGVLQAPDSDDYPLRGLTRKHLEAHAADLEVLTGGLVEADDTSH